ncbi:YcnI family protein [Micromonospora yasonensis]|uniref:YcnI family protein n=1 Tax=Micromonospora yasonensis TaxID=1128667 RepID=UPI00222FAF55|nr:YcnI family protein [Micromonospora yasonensis]MCW3838590.1 YcnI family protein [Micromonospora yasonensis]
MMRARSVARLAAATLAGTLAAVTIGVGVSSAHVSVNPREATQGGYAKLAFRVPNERDNAGTTKVEVALPADAPLASVSVRPMPGWTVQVEKTTLAKPIEMHGSQVTEAPSKITWTAEGGNANMIKPGQFQEFEISAGPLPEVDTMIFKALQTYSNGEVVRWIEEPSADGSEPEHPAPVLKLAKAPAKDAAATPAAGSNNIATVSASDTTNTDDGRTGWALTFGIAGLVAGLAGLGFGLLAWRRRPAAGSVAK